MPSEDNPIPENMERRISDSVSIRLVDAKFQQILEKLSEIQADIKDHETRLRQLEDAVRGKAESEAVDKLSESVVQLKERLSLWQIGQGAFTVISGIVATIVSYLLGGGGRNP